MEKEDRPRMHEWRTNGRMEDEWRRRIGHECTNGGRMEKEDRPRMDEWTIGRLKGLAF